MSRQDAVFLEGEGDGWYARNREVLLAREPSRDTVLRAIAESGIGFGRVLEVGASNGFRLGLLRASRDCRAVAVEPSEKAIAEGRQLYPEVEFLRGTASAIPIKEDGAFDLVIVNFVMHWIDRATLLRSVAEIDRMVADGGYLVLGDFYPDAPQKVRYHHLPDQDVWTYKQDYPSLFAATGLYLPVHLSVFAHTGEEKRPDAPGQDRIMVSVLRKSLDAGYATAVRDGR